MYNFHLESTNDSGVDKSLKHDEKRHKYINLAKLQHACKSLLAVVSCIGAQSSSSSPSIASKDCGNINNNNRKYQTAPFGVIKSSRERASPVYKRPVAGYPIVRIKAEMANSGDDDSNLGDSGRVHLFLDHPIKPARQSLADGAVLRHGTLNYIYGYVDRTNFPDKPFRCSQCTKDDIAKGFPRHANLQRHFKKHTQEKFFSCHLCPKRFREKHHKLKHMRTVDHTKQIMRPPRP